jgi:hypothetical protein
LLDIEFNKDIQKFLSYFIDYREHDAVGKEVKDKLHNSESFSENFVNLKCKYFSFHSNYSIILTLKTILRLIFLPIAIIFLFNTLKLSKRVIPVDSNLKQVEAKEKAKNKNNKPKKEPTLTIQDKIQIKIISGQYIMSQFESYTYLVTSLRVSPNLPDILFMSLNTTILILAQLFSIILSIRRSKLSKVQFLKLKK